MDSKLLGGDSESLSEGVAEEARDEQDSYLPVNNTRKFQLETTSMDVIILYFSNITLP